jgi:hypothetical protein
VADSGDATGPELSTVDVPKSKVTTPDTAEVGPADTDVVRPAWADSVSVASAAPRIAFVFTLLMIVVVSEVRLAGPGNTGTHGKRHFTGEARPVNSPFSLSQEAAAA